MTTTEARSAAISAITEAAKTQPVPVARELLLMAIRDGQSTFTFPTR
jgi:hypothetical protein